MSVQVVIFEHPFKSERRIEHVAPDKIKNILLLCRELPEQFEYSIIKNDLVATLEDETVDGDNLIIRAIPAGGLTKKEGENIGVGKMLYGAGLIILGGLLSMTVIGAGLGASLIAFGAVAIFGGAATVIGANFLPKEEESVNNGSVRSRPNIRGASNSANPDGKLPLVLGRHLLTPYYATTPFTEIKNSATSKNNSGQRLYYNTLFALGYAPLKISNIKVGETVIASGSFTSASATPTTLTFDGPYAGISGTFVNGALPSAFTYVKKEEQLNIALDALSFKSFTLDIVVNAAAFTFTAPVNTKLDLSEDDGGYGIQIGDMVYFTNFANAGNNNYFLVTNLTVGAGSFYNNVMNLSSSSVGLVNETKTGATGSAAPSNIVTTPKNTTSIKVIITFPSGLCAFDNHGIQRNDKGSGNDGVKVKAYYRAVGTFNWPEMSYFYGSSDYLSGFFADSTVRFQATVTGLTAGEYEVRVARESGKYERDNTTFYDNVEWSILQCTTNEKVWDDASVANVSFLHLRFLATTALANSISKISLIAESVYTESVTGANWTEDASYLYSPASAFLWALTGPYNPRPLTGADRTTYIDYTSIEAWRDYCATIVTGSEQMHTCNAVMTDSINLQDFLNNICSTGRAFFTMVDGKYSVVWDAPTTTVIQHITPRNSWNFQGNKTFDEVPTLMQVSFIDADNEWTADEYDIWENGGSASSTPREAVTSWGVTSYKEICRNMRYVMACLKLRPETFSVYMDAEQLACTIGDRVQVSHDAMLVGYSWGRVKTVTLDGSSQVVSFTTDEPVSMSTGLSYVVRTRNVSGMLYADVNTVVGESNELVFTTPQIAGSVTVGDLFQFGEKNIESIPCIISGIEMQEDLSAKLSLILYDEDVYAADSVTPPAFTSKISKKPIFYTSTVTTEVARQAISEVAGIDIPAATGVAATATASKRPRYIGKYLDTLPASSNENDWVLSYSTTPANRFVAYWYIDPAVEDDTGTWTGITNPTTEQITAMWSDLCWVSNQTSGGSPIYVTTIGDISEYIGSSINFIEVLGANLAFVNQLFANYLKVTNTLRVGDFYDQYGNTVLSGNVYACVYGGDIYMQTAGTGDFIALSQTSRNWIGMCASPNGNVYACVYGGDIYTQTSGAGNFVALSQATRNWRGMTASPNENVYACVPSGDIYMQTAGTGDFIALSQTSRNWIEMCASPNGNVYACVSSGDIYMQTAGTGDFIALSQTSRNWVGMCASPNGNVYAADANGDIYMQTAGTGDFIALSQTSRNWRGMAASSNGNVYVEVNNGDIYMQTAGSSDFVELSQTSRNWWGMCAAPVYGKGVFLNGLTGELIANEAILKNARISGSLSAATGTFKGALIAASGTFTGELSAASGSFSGRINASTIGNNQTTLDSYNGGARLAYEDGSEYASVSVISDIRGYSSGEAVLVSGNATRTIGVRLNAYDNAFRPDIYDSPDLGTADFPFKDVYVSGGIKNQGIYVDTTNTAIGTSGYALLIVVTKYTGAGEVAYLTQDGAALNLGGSAGMTYTFSSGQWYASVGTGHAYVGIVYQEGPLP
jgi:hypothetical protein